MDKLKFRGEEGETLLRREESKNEYNLGSVRSAKTEEGGFPSLCPSFGLVKGKS